MAKPNLIWKGQFGRRKQPEMSRLEKPAKFRNLKFTLGAERKECRGPDSNRHGVYTPRDFKSLASTNSATPAAEDILSTISLPGQYIEGSFVKSLYPSY